MKIIEFLPNLKSGGGEKLVVDLATALSDLGHECKILTLFAPSDDDILISQVSTKIIRENLGKHLGADFNCFFRFWRYLIKEKPDIVHVHLQSIKYTLIAAIFYRNCKYFATIHSDAKREAGTGLEKYIRFFLFGTKLVKPVTISKESESSFERFYGYKTTIIPNGASPYKPESNLNALKRLHDNVDFLFIHAARLDPVKNQTMLMEAVEQLHHEGYSCRLIILGRNVSGEVFDYINSHESEIIMYLGEVANVRDYISVSDCFCISSFQEGMPITLLESYSVGCPVVATPVGGCLDVVKTGITGFLSEDVSIESYKKALANMMNLNDIEYHEMRKQCLMEYKMNYSISNCADSYISLFNGAESYCK